MTVIGWIQILLYCAIVAALVVPLGGSMTRVFNGERTFLAPILRPVEAALYWIGGVNAKREQHWVAYTVSMLFFHVGGFLILYALMRLQALLPFNPAEQSAVAEDLSFNTAVSFITNTNWQNYGGESTLSYFVQMLGLTHQNFLSAATGIVLAVALIRGFARASMKTIGNFWVDITRCTLYILMPICVVYALFLVWQGIPQTLGPYVEATTLEGAKQTIALGPVASQIAIKMLGTNGGGFFNANATHPFENPTPLSNYVQMISIFAIGAALTNVFGRMVGNQRQGWAILAAMGVLFIAGVIVCYWAEAHGNDAFTAMGLAGGNMEGKEVRFGIPASALFAVITTAASCGAVNAMHDSFTALGGMIPLVNMQLGEIIVGGAEPIHPLLLSPLRGRDAGRPLLDDHPGDGDRRLARGKEIAPAVGRHLPDDRRAVRRAGGWGDRDHRRPDLLPRARARSHRRTTRDGRRYPVRIELIRG